MKWKLTTLLSLAALVALGIALSSRITVFVVAPIAVLPEGQTYIMARTERMEFLDSADAVCTRTLGDSNLLCRTATLAAIANQSTVYGKLPYNGLLYWLAGGRS